MRARELFLAGRLGEAIEALGVELRSDPTDVRRRTFLFELLCFAGEYERAGKQLEVLARGDVDTEAGAWILRSALHAERIRQEMFATHTLPATGRPPSPVSGTLNGRPFASLVDADPRVGARLELFAAGEYQWIPLELVASVRMEEPRRLRDLLWASARVAPGQGYRGGDLGELLIPALAPLTWQHPDDQVRLGRATEWVTLGDESEPVPMGQKLLLVDGEEIPFLEIRELEIHGPVQPAT